MRTEFVSKFTATKLEISYYGDEGLCIRITDLDKGDHISHVFPLDKGVKKMTKAMRQLIGK